ncbi:xylanase [Stenotrophomonas sp. ESTM1D_MKCIP4_1]|uniref:alpha/beta hydrolase n=1 Tax=Stenotrophomonas sp. ESTM1D_MKCIP4_1 TaxID=2072414 RepID=UPI000D53D1DF|nr:alpha/beta hydrolase [Stenotrophomonas sp. ESTM1D_MKCIP4_1]AWH51722.1 xylanase [Stenotrophomonas sp. ESTM1D_MKCIP4_1]
MRLRPVVLLLSGLLLALPLISPAAPLRDNERPGQELAGEQIALWPAGQVPGEQGPARPARVVERSRDPAHPDRYVDQIDAPYLLVHVPAQPNGRALLVIPGGGYQRVVIDKEDSALLPEWVDRAGYTLFVLRYRLPQPGRDRQAALADAQRALRVVRDQAARRGLDADSVSVMGFSAGGHVAARLATGFDAQVYPARDSIDRLSARPARAVLVYPVIDMGAHAHSGSRGRLLGDHPDPALAAQYSMQQQVRADMPPTLLVHANDDRVVSVHNSERMAAALADAGVEHELHLFAHGGHGFGMRVPAGSTLALWPLLAEAWLAAKEKGAEMGSEPLSGGEGIRPQGSR